MCMEKSVRAEMRLSWMNAKPMNAELIMKRLLLTVSEKSSIFS